MRDFQFLPPEKKISAVSKPQPALPRPVVNESQTEQPVSASPGLSTKRKHLVYIVSVLFLFLVAIIGSGVWYVQALRPVATEGEGVRIIIEPGDGVGTVANKLKEAGLIRSAAAFRIHGEITGYATRLQTGGFIIMPTESMAEIMEHIANSKSDEFDVTIVPGLTLDDIKKQLVDVGFDETDVQVALERTYDHPLVRDYLPNNASLEGYIFPDTYRVAADANPEDVFTKSFDEFLRLIDENNYVERAKRQGLTLHEAITLASIIELEVTEEGDQRQVAQVFLKRLEEDMPLGSDPTFLYAAERDGVRPSINYDSPYNTRRNKGLPPGPIANFTIDALEAVVQPARGDYLYFVSGDDGTTHFSKTLEEHESNIDRYCTALCQ